MKMELIKTEKKGSFLVKTFALEDGTEATSCVHLRPKGKKE